MNASDHVNVTSSQTKKLFSKITKHRIGVITNGFDKENRSPVPLDSEFSLTHIGSLLDQRNPMLSWEVRSELTEELPDVKSQFQLVRVGNVSAEIRATIESAG